MTAQSDNNQLPLSPNGLEQLSASLPNSMEDEAWIAVIRQMESIYTDLLRYQVELEQKNAELENAQRFIKSVMSSMSDILVVCDINGRIQETNLALEHALNKSQQEVQGELIATLFSPEYTDLISEFPQQIRSNPISDCEADLLDSQGQTVPMAVNCSARYDHNNRLSGLVLTGRPLGELRKAYAQLNHAHADLKTAQLQLIQSEKMASLGRLVAGVAHELNNPISIIYGNMFALRGYEERFTSYLKQLQHTSDPKQQARLRSELRIDPMLDDIGPLIDGSVEGAERVNNIVQSLLRFSIPQRQSNERFKLLKICETALHWILRSASIKPQVTIDVAKGLSLLNNEGYVHQILINLLQNAVDALDGCADPKLSIQATLAAEHVEIAILDNGSGIAEDDLVRLFDPFFTRKSVGKGTGLGLYVSYGLATEQCGGTLRGENHPDGGAEFVLRLPLENSV